ncbi:terpene synthase family protein [Streptomyces hygroscopicus]|uniref:terpene synthase family protein n=1 Tax=Streptomyces hygroscopicus TaxID=1912 RepID=UPI000AAFC8E8|nr:hypothetical protein [Streptomyces hygroscopicus]
MRFEIPTRFPVPFTPLLNPYTGRVSQRFWEWIEDRTLAPTDRARERLRRSGIELASCWCWPWADPEQLLEGMKWMFFFFRFDDQMEEGVAQRDFVRVNRAVEEITGIMHNQREAGDSALAQELHRTWLHTQEGRPSDWVDTFRRHYCDLVRSYADQSRFNYAPGQGQVMPMAEYESFREITYGMEWVYDFMEMVNSSGTYLPEAVRRSSPMRTLRWSSTLQQALLNDVFSAAREDHQERQINSVVIYQQEKGCSAQEAVGAVLERMAELVTVYKDACGNLRAELHGSGTRPEVISAVERFITNMDAVIGANHDWHHIVMRYATDDVSSGEGAYCYPDDL